jgi:hypothetical protein
MAVEASKRSTRIRGIANSPYQPARSKVDSVKLRVIATELLNDDWPQFMAETAAGSL